jgi:hypothetical protein
MTAPEIEKPAQPPYARGDVSVVTECRTARTIEGATAIHLQTGSTMNEHPQPACSTKDHSQTPVIDTTKPPGERSGKSGAVPTARRLSAADRLGLTRPFVSVLACGVTLLGVSACGSSHPSSLTPAAKAFLISGFERNGVPAADVTQVVNCVKPALQGHGTTTLSAVKNLNSKSTNDVPAWLSAVGKKCGRQLVASTASTASGNSGSGNSGNSSSTPASAPAVSSPSTPAVTDTEPADAQACRTLRNAFVTFHADQNETNEDALLFATTPHAAMTQTLYNAFQTLNGDLDNAELSGSQDPTAQADEQAVATGCAAAGVTMPSDFTG